MKTEINVEKDECIESVMDSCIGLIREFKTGYFDFVSDYGSETRECFYLRIETTEGIEQVEFVGEINQIEADALLNSYCSYKRNHTKYEEFRRASEYWKYRLEFVGGKYSGFYFTGGIHFSYRDNNGP